MLEPGAMVEDEADDAADGAAQRVEAAAVRDRVALALVFLCGEVEANGCGCLEFMERDCRDVKAAGAEEEANVFGGGERKRRHTPYQRRHIPMRIESDSSTLGLASMRSM